MRRVAVYGSITDSLVASILKCILEEARDKVVQEQVRIMHKSLEQAIASATAAASNLQLIHRDMALGLLLAAAGWAYRQSDDISVPWTQSGRPRTSGIWQENLHHALHRGLTSHFKVPKKPAPKSSTQFRPSMHQRLGPPVGQEGSKQSFRNGQQNKSWSSNFSNACITGGTPAEGRGMVLPRRQLDHLRGPDNEGVLVGARLAVFAQQWRNLLGKCRSSKILQSVVLLKWECHQPPLTRTPIHFPTRNKKQDLQKAVDSLLEKGAIEPVHRSHFLGFFSRLFLVPKKTGDLRPVIDLSTLNRHLVIPQLQRWPRQSGLQSMRMNGRYL